VTDSGSGIHADVLPRVFEPFFTTKPAGRGTGLGLSIVHGIITQSAGSIEVHSVLGEGTTFTIHLPVYEAASAAPPSAPAEPSRSTGGETVLIVDDDAAVGRVYTRVLAAAGFRVHVASSGRDALLLCERADVRVDLLLTDVVMPGLSGRQLAELARELRPDIKVLFTSGYNDDELVRRGVSDDPRTFLAKPYTPQALVAKVRSVLDRR
jgi:CheY-like chemotaxis protein